MPVTGFTNEVAHRCQQMNTKDTALIPLSSSVFRAAVVASHSSIVIRASRAWKSFGPGTARLILGHGE
jgi:hypothetical protein